MPARLNLTLPVRTNTVKCRCWNGRTGYWRQANGGVQDFGSMYNAISGWVHVTINSNSRASALPEQVLASGPFWKTHMVFDQQLAVSLLQPLPNRLLEFIRHTCHFNLTFQVISESTAGDLFSHLVMCEQG